MSPDFLRERDELIGPMTPDRLAAILDGLVGDWTAQETRRIDDAAGLAGPGDFRCRAEFMVFDETGLRVANFSIPETEPNWARQVILSRLPKRRNRFA